MRSPHVVSTTVTLLALLTVGAASAAVPGHAVRSASFQDPTGDATGRHATPAQRHSVDVVSGRFRVKGHVLHITTSVLDLRDEPGNQFADVLVREKGLTTVSLSAETGQHVVNAFDGDHFYVCKGATVKVRGSVVRETVPLSCIPQFSRPTLQASMILARQDGSTIAADHAARTGPFRFPG